MPLLVAVTRLLDIVTRGIDLLLEVFGKVYVTCVPGNHSRLDKKPRAKNATYDNVEWIFYYFLRKHYRDQGNENVQVEVPNTFESRIQIYNTRYLVTHGAEFRGGGGITGPLLPWMRGYQKKQQQSASVSRWTTKKLNFDILLMGHWHQAAFLEEIIVNGAIVEMGEYAHQAQFPYQPSCSNLWMTHPRHGVSIPMKVYAEEGIKRTDPGLPADLVPVFKY
jgi:predicted phosphodiesterase